MTPKKDSFCIILLGAWNPSIFNQDWILKNLINDVNAQITIAFALDDPTAPRKITFNGINLFPGRKQLLLSPEEPTLEGMLECSTMLNKIIELLGHTPVGSAGLNFSFQETDNLIQLLNAFDLPDSADIKEQDYTLNGSRIERRFKLKDGHILNLALQESEANNGAEINFNFHYELSDISKYKSLFTENHMTERYQRATDFCKNIYAIELEEPT